MQISPSSLRFGMASAPQTAIASQDTHSEVTTADTVMFSGKKADNLSARMSAANDFLTLLPLEDILEEIIEEDPSQQMPDDIDAFRDYLADTLAEESTVADLKKHSQNTFSADPGVQEELRLFIKSYLVTYNLENMKNTLEEMLSKLRELPGFGQDDAPEE